MNTPGIAGMRILLELRECEYSQDCGSAKRGGIRSLYSLRYNVSNECLLYEKEKKCSDSEKNKVGARRKSFRGAAVFSGMRNCRVGNSGGGDILDGADEEPVLDGKGQGCRIFDGKARCAAHGGKESGGR